MGLKCLTTGFEFITSTLVMMTVPIVYYARRDAWSIVRTLASLTAASAGAALAVLVTLVVLSGQVATFDGDPTAGVEHIATVLARRSPGDPADFPNLEIKNPLRAQPLDVLKTYLSGNAINTQSVVNALKLPVRRLSIAYTGLIYLFAACSLLLLGITRIRQSAGRATDLQAGRAYGLLLATWWSALAPLSWFLIFTGHAAIHTHVDFIVWHLPFTLWGFALVGVCINSIREEASHRLRSPTRGSVDV